MRVFKEPNLSNGWKCPICGTDKEGEIVLVGVIYTEDGNNMEAEQIHLSCINLLYDKPSGVLYQRVV